MRRVETPTGTAHILVDRTGENQIVVVSGANAAVTAGDADNAIAVMSGGDHLLLQLEIPTTAIRTAMQDARQRGVITVLNIAPMTDAAGDLAAHADIVIANETEFDLLAGRGPLSSDQREKALMKRHGETGQTLIVTLGADGVIAARDGSLHTAPGLAIDPVDTVGAGDTFCGYLAADLDRGHGFGTALRRAAIAGSLACLKPGAQPSIPMESDVNEAS